MRTQPQFYDYFASLRQIYLHPTWLDFLNDLNVVLVHIQEAKSGYLKEALLAELGSTFTHFLNIRGNYQDQLALALSAAEAARKLGRSTIEGQLRGDAISWSLIEHYADPMGAQAHLERAQELATSNKNNDLKALSTAFVARAYLLLGDLRQAQSSIDQALCASCSPEIQMRIYWIASDIAKSQRNFDRAITNHENALTTERKFSQGRKSSVHAAFQLGHVYIQVHEMTHAREQFSRTLSWVQSTQQLSPARTAYAKLGLARGARLIGDLSTARDHAWDAAWLIRSQQMTPGLKQLMSRFRTELSLSSASA